MLINKLESPSFQRCEMHKSAQKILAQMPKDSKAEVWRKTNSIRNTENWNLFVKGRPSNQGQRFSTYFINKNNQLEGSFLGDLIPIKVEENRVLAVANSIDLHFDTTNSYSLKFKSEQRAKEVFEKLNESDPKTNMEIINRAIETVKILEEAFKYQNKQTNKNKPTFLGKLRSFLGI